MESYFKKTDSSTITVPMIAAMAVAPAGPAHVAEAPAGSTEVLAQLRQLAGAPELRLRVTGDQMVALIDVAKLFMGLNNNEAANAARRVLDAFPAVTSKCFICQFEGGRSAPRGGQFDSASPFGYRKYYWGQ
jgi:hypothetical protein